MCLFPKFTVKSTCSSISLQQLHDHQLSISRFQLFILYICHLIDPHAKRKTKHTFSTTQIHKYCVYIQRFIFHANIFFFLTQSLMISLFYMQCLYIKPCSLTCKVSLRRTQPQVISFSKYEKSEIYLQNEIYKDF